MNHRKKPQVVPKKTESAPSTPVKEVESDEEMDIVIGDHVYYLSGETAFPEELLLQVKLNQTTYMASSDKNCWFYQVLSFC